MWTRIGRGPADWMEEDRQWSLPLLLGEPGELDEIADSGNAMFVGGRLPLQVHQDPELAWYRPGGQILVTTRSSGWVCGIGRRGMQSL